MSGESERRGERERRGEGERGDAVHTKVEERLRRTQLDANKWFSLVSWI